MTCHIKVSYNRLCQQVRMHALPQKSRVVITRANGWSKLERSSKASNVIRHRTENS
ncbi:2622_t:CDS:2 [Acaulospora colombiana]|uniref:2622_t:CDS:1 n=1 Tax=Acaulospora colombiana TaxID=27376 RepID=A0ACA9L306_9GLOM|nr:2622_t:CDS:2 [Acaulospora colombiana]